MLFDLLADEAYYSQPIALRHPIVFYEGHLPAFSFNTLVKRALGGPSIDPRLEQLFARGIDPRRSATRRRRTARDRLARSRRGSRRSPTRPIGRVLDVARTRRPRSPGPSAARSRGSGVRHPRARGDAPGDAALHVASAAVRSEAAAGRLSCRASTDRAAGGTSGSTCRPDARRSASIAEAVPFGWDNECPSFVADVPRVRDRAPRRDQRGVPRVRRSRRLSRSAVVAAGRLGVDPAGAGHPSAVLGASGRRLVVARDVRSASRCRCRGRCTSATPRRRRSPAGAARACRPKPSSSARRTARPRDASARHPWGDADADADARRASISRAGIRSRPAAIPQGASAWGVDDLVGNGWEWTSTPFAPFPGFTPLASYPGILGRLLRRRALRHERRVAGDGARAAAADASATGSGRAIRTSTRRSAA